MNNNCSWHEKETMIDPEETIGCPECGRLIATKDCETCHLTFLDWSYRGFDDIVAGPAATSNGDFCCTHCLPHIESDIEKQEEEDALDFGFECDPY